jgi:hypothetical protein
MTRFRGAVFPLSNSGKSVFRSTSNLGLPCYNYRLYPSKSRRRLTVRRISLNAQGLDSGDRGDPPPGSRVPARAAIFVALFTVSAAFGYFDLYSTFEPYDDEGYMLQAVKHFVAGSRLYDEVRTSYGPVYFLYEWMVHVPLGLPLTNDAVRINSLVFWMATAFLCALAVGAITRSTAFAALAYVAAFFHLRSLPHEPGHPQELAGLLIAVVLLLPTLRSLATERGRGILAALLGGITAALVLVKINVGVLVGTSLVIAGSAALGPGWFRTLVRTFATSAALALPWLLMLKSIRAPNDMAPLFAHFGVLVNLATVPVLLFAWSPAPRSWEGLLGPRHVASAAIAFAAVLAAVLAAILRTGTTIGGLVESVILLPRRFTVVFGAPPNTHWVCLVWASLTCAAALIYFIRERHPGNVVSGSADSRLPTWIPVMKVGFGCLLLWAALRPYHVPNRVVMLGTPCVWLLLVPPVPSAPLARLVMACVAALQILQIYPVPGSQLAFGSLPVVPAGLICLADGFAWFRATTDSVGLAHAARRRRWSVLGATVVIAFMVGGACYDFAQSYRRYASDVPLGLPGAEQVRVPEATAVVYRELTDILRSSADCFVATRGMNSLYLWTGQQPPNRIVIGSELNVFTSADQMDIFRSLMSHARPMVVHDTIDGPDDTRPLMREINREFRPWRQVGRYLLLVPKTAPSA